MIQTLLLFLKLSLLGPCPSFILPSAIDTTSSSKTRKQRHAQIKEPTTETAEERLEHYMDKLSMWQLTDSIEPIHQSQTTHVNGMTKQKDDAHWTQSFCEDVVAPLYALIAFSHIFGY